MRHFEREGKRNLWLLALIFGLPVAIGLCTTIAYRTMQAARVDACLDRGGSWDYELGVCDPEQSHPGP